MARTARTSLVPPVLAPAILLAFALAALVGTAAAQEEEFDDGLWHHAETAGWAFTDDAGAVLETWRAVPDAAAGWARRDADTGAQVVVSVEGIPAAVLGDDNSVSTARLHVLLDRELERAAADGRPQTLVEQRPTRGAGPGVVRVVRGVPEGGGDPVEVHQVIRPVLERMYRCTITLPTVAGEDGARAPQELTEAARRIRAGFVLPDLDDVVTEAAGRSVRATVHTKSGFSMVGIARGGVLAEVREGGDWRTLDVTGRVSPAELAERGAGLRLWYVEQVGGAELEPANGFVFVPYSNIEQVEIAGVLSVVDEKSLAEQARKAGEEAAARREKIDAMLAEQREKERERLAALRAEREEAARARAAEETQKLMDEYRAILAEFPPTAGWSAERKQTIERRWKVLGQPISAEERRFVDVFPKWQAAQRALVGALLQPAGGGEGGDDGGDE